MPDAQCSVSPNPVVFAAGAVGPVTVTVTAVDDAVIEGAHSCTIVTNPTVSNDPNYSGLDPLDLVVSVADNDTADISITPLNVTVRENRPARTYEVVLTNAPTAGEIVTITPTFDAAQITVSPATLQFNDSNWNVPQVFSVEAVDNAVADGQRTTTITHAVTSTVGGSPFDGMPAPDVTVTVRDDDGGNNGGGGNNNGGGGSGGSKGGQTVAAAPPVPLCADLNGTTNAIVRANPPAGVYGVHCRIIAESTRFIRSAAEVGVQSVLDRGVIHAVDVFSPSNANAGGTNICLQGTGELIFLDASAAPRTAQSLPASTQGGYTCATLPGVGTVVLVNGAAAPAALAPVVATTSTPLSGCTVTTTHAVRLRAEPNASSAVLTTLPYDTSYQAVERIPGWMRLIWSNTQGWVSDDYINTTGTCGG